MTRSSTHPHRAWHWGAGLTLCAALTAVPLSAQAAPGAASASSPPQAPAGTGPASISVSLSGKVAGNLTSQYMGLSFESSTLDNGYRYDNVGNLPQLLRNLGTGVIRFGGSSADTDFSGVTQKEASAVARLASATGWKVLYTEGLLHFDAARVKADARLVGKTLGSHLYAFACGNEPDQYAASHAKPASYTLSAYLSQVNACYAAIRAGSPGAPIAGPDISWNPAWLSAYASRDKKTASALSAHYYPLGCARPGEDPTTAADTLLSSVTAGQDASRLSEYAAIAAKAGKPLRVTETNSACAGGVPGASNAYATSLWIIDYLLTGAKLGLAGVNLHGGLNTLCGGYTVLCSVGKNTYRAQPVYYGMLFTRLFGTGGFLPVTASAQATAEHLVAFADRPKTTGSIRVMLENTGPSSKSTTLRLDGYKGSSVQVLRMTGGSPTATSGIKIQGASVAGNGTLSPGAASVVPGKSGAVPLTLAPYSAVLVTLK
jgi:hypothetical protein